MPLKRFKNKFLLNHSDNKFIEFATKFSFLNESKNFKGSVLIEAPLNENFFLIKNFLIGSFLSKKYNLRLIYYINFNKIRSYKSLSNKIYYFFIYNFFSFSKIKKIYNSFCQKMCLNCFYVNNSKQILKKNFTYKNIFNFHYKRIKFGDLILDSYFYYFYQYLYPGEIKNCINEKNFQKHFSESLSIIKSFEKIFNNEKIKFLVNNYSGYLDHGIAARFAEKYKIPIFYLSEVDRPFIKSKYSRHKRNYHKYKIDFLKLPGKEKKIDQSIKILENRFLGKKDFAINYLNNNSYRKTEKKFLHNNKKTICLFLHNTADSLFGFPSMNFHQQKDWIKKTLGMFDGNIKDKFNILVKIHPNETLQGELYLKKIISNFPFSIAVDKNVNNYLIINSNLVAGITLHGSVGLELAFHKIPTIYGNDSPYIAFDFCLKTKNLNHYKNLINSIKFFKKKNIYKKESAIFYYMNYLHNWNGKLKSNIDSLGMLEFLKNGNELSNQNLVRYLTFLKKKGVLNKVYEQLNQSEKAFNDF